MDNPTESTKSTAYVAHTKPKWKRMNLAEEDQPTNCDLRQLLAATLMLSSLGALSFLSLFSMVTNQHSIHALMLCCLTLIIVYFLSRRSDIVPYVRTM